MLYSSNVICFRVVMGAIQDNIRKYSNNDRDKD